MAQQGFAPPTFAPDLLARQLRLQQDAEDAKRLREDGAQMPQGQMVSGHYVAPSWTQYLAQGLKSYMGGRASSEMPDRMAELLRDTRTANRARFDGVSPVSGASPQTIGRVLAEGQGQPAQPAGMSWGGETPASQPAGHDPQRLAAGLRGDNAVPLLHGMSPDMSFAAYEAMGPDGYFKELAKQTGPTDFQRNAMAAGLQPGTPGFQQAMQGNIQQANHIPLQSAAPGATMLDPRTNQPVFSAPQNGIQMQYGPGGQAQASAVPGFGQAQAQIAGMETAAQEGARAAYDLQAIPDGQGGTITMPRSQAVGALGGGGQGFSGQPTGPNGMRFGQTPSPAQQAYDVDTSKAMSQKFAGLQEQAGMARQMLGMYDLAEQALGSGVRTGFGAEAELNLRQIGAAMGLDTNADKLAGGELVKSIQNRMALIMRSPDGGMGMPGAVSDRDIKFLKDSQIGIDRSPEGNRQMLKAFRALEQRKVQVADLAQQYVEQHGRMDAGFNRALREWSDANPLFASNDPQQRQQDLDRLLGF